MSFCGFSRPRTRRGLQRISRGISATAGSGLIIIINPASVANFCISYTAASSASRIFATCDTIIIIFHVTLLYVCDEFQYNIIINRIV